MPDGSWSLSLGRQTLIDLPDGTVNFTVIVTDAAGNTSTTATTANVLTTTLPVATLDLPFGDGILNTTEIQAIQTLTGKTGITSAGQEVIVTVTNKTTLADTTFTAVADGLGGWSRELSLPIWRSLPKAITALASRSPTGSAIPTPAPRSM
nr:hypothetical protein PJ912_19600 [Pectobacterium colocasium]